MNFVFGNGYRNIGKYCCKYFIYMIHLASYYIYPKYVEIYACANRADPDQTAALEQFDQCLHCLS